MCSANAKSLSQMCARVNKLNLPDVARCEVFLSACCFVTTATDALLFISHLMLHLCCLLGALGTTPR
jgi:hypothetical protein